ncbi:hypothetical protein [Caballeronia zhejiangensis]|uniref:hypothetical protein n=1 Tax=Caballeronia zhejiangensis TaxID=871203 RepID=UPI0015888B92|nr:hypothetical protein [Caballeronia zhejiangensis]
MLAGEHEVHGTQAKRPRQLNCVSHWGYLEVRESRIRTWSWQRVHASSSRYVQSAPAAAILVEKSANNVDETRYRPGHAHLTMIAGPQAGRVLVVTPALDATMTDERAVDADVLVRHLALNACCLGALVEQISHDIMGHQWVAVLTESDVVPNAPFVVSPTDTEEQHVAGDLLRQRSFAGK